MATAKSPFNGERAFAYFVVINLPFIYIMASVVFYRFIVFSFLLSFPKFSVSSASVYPFNLSSTHHLTADLDIVFSVFNPSDEWTAKYGTLDVLIRDGSTCTDLANTTLSLFSQVHLNKTSITAHLSILSTYIDDAAASDGIIKLGVTLLSWVRFQFLGVTTRSHRMMVSCPYVHVPVGFSSPRVPWECNVILC